MRVKNSYLAGDAAVIIKKKPYKDALLRITVKLILAPM